MLLMQFAFLKRLEHRGAEAVLRAGATRCSCLSWNEIAPLVSNFTEPGDYATYCKAPDYGQWFEAMIKEIKELEKMGC